MSTHFVRPLGEPRRVPNGGGRLGHAPRRHRRGCAPYRHVLAQARAAAAAPRAPLTPARAGEPGNGEAPLTGGDPPGCGAVSVTEQVVEGEGAGRLLGRAIEPQP